MVGGASAARPTVLEVEQLLKLLIQGDTQDQGQLCGGTELPGLVGADGITG